LIAEIDCQSSEQSDGPPKNYRKLFKLATAEFWMEFIEARQETFRETRKGLESCADVEAGPALRSLAAAEQQLTTLTPELCVAFLEAWQEDLAEWEITIEATNNVSSVWEAMNELGLRQWRLAEFGDAYVAEPQRGAARRLHSVMTPINSRPNRVQQPGKNTATCA
jgi:hypothetical protein